MGQEEIKREIRKSLYMNGKGKKYIYQSLWDPVNTGCGGKFIAQNIYTGKEGFQLMSSAASLRLEKEEKSTPA